MQEGQSGLGQRRLVRHRPQDDRRAVLVASDHLTQLAPGIGQGGLVLPLDRPVNRDLGPYQQAELVCNAHHVLVVRVVGQSDEVAVELLHPFEQGARVLGTVRPAITFRRLFVHTDATEEHRLSIEQDVGSVGRDGAEADPVRDPVVGSCDLHLVQLRVGRRPKNEIGGDVDGCTTVGIGGDDGLHACLRDADPHHPAGSGFSVKLDPAGDTVGRALGELEEVVANEGRRQLDQGHITGQPAVVPPVGVDGRDGVEPSFVVDLDHQGVALGPDLLGDLEVEGGEAALVGPELGPVEVDVGLVVGGAEVDEQSRAGRELVVEDLPVPNGAFVEKQPLVLRVPVAWHLEQRRGVEIVLDQVALIPRLSRHEEPVLARLVTVVVEA